MRVGLIRSKSVRSDGEGSSPSRSSFTTRRPLPQGSSSDWPSSVFAFDAATPDERPSHRTNLEADTTPTAMSTDTSTATAVPLQNVHSNEPDPTPPPCCCSMDSPPDMRVAAHPARHETGHRPAGRPRMKSAGPATMQAAAEGPEVESTGNSCRAASTKRDKPNELRTQFRDRRRRLGRRRGRIRCRRNRRDHRSGTYPPATPTGEYTVWCSCISRARNAPAHDSM